LIQAAIKALKLPKDFQLAERFKHNLPQRYTKVLKTFKGQGHFPLFPLGSDLTDIEIQIGGALKKLKKLSKRQLIMKMAGSFLIPIQPQNAEGLKRLGLEHPIGLKEKLMQKLVNASLT
jgi:hypothetical protein